jgi:proline dehydrogenase
MKAYSRQSILAKNINNAQRSLLDLIPNSWVVSVAAPYLSGQNAESAIAKGHKLFEKEHVCGTLDILGENSSSQTDCDRNVEKFIELIDLVRRNSLSTPFERENFTISMKPSMFSDHSPNFASRQPSKMDAGFERIAKVVDYASLRKVRLTLEAEDSRWTGFQLDAFQALINAGYTNLGTVLQSRLFRTKQDISKIGERDRVRLVIGIYREPTAIAYADKRTMKNLLIEYSRELFERGCYVELATHDTGVIQKFFSEVVIPQEIPPTQFETQFLLGVPRLKLQRDLINGNYFAGLEKTKIKGIDHLVALRRAGVLVRMYLPFGPKELAGPYCKRRLVSNPNLLLYGLNNLLAQTGTAFLRPEHEVLD